MEINIINKSLEIFPSQIKIETLVAMEELLSLYNPLIGPIKSITSQLCTPFGIPIYSMGGNHYDFHISHKIKLGQAFIPAGGKGETLSATFLGVLGETVERILPLIYSKFIKNKVFYGTPKEMRKKRL